MALIERVRPALSIVIHQPLVGIGVAGTTPLAVRIRMLLSRGTGLPAKQFGCGTGCHGTFAQWVHSRYLGLPVTIELERRPTAARLRRTSDAVLAVTRVLADEART